jgi:Flp pilus assembly protein TadG
MQPCARRKRFDESGQTLPLIALFMVILLGILGMVVDLGNAYRVHQQLQATADAAAAAGADNLPNTATAVSAASSYSAAAGGKNSIPGAGTINVSTTTDCSTSSQFCNPANTVHVSETAHVPTTFLRLFGINTIDETANASACSPCGGAPLDVMIVLDRTGSMGQSNKLVNAKAGITAFMDTMDPSVDNVGLAILPPAPSAAQACTDVTNDFHLTQNPSPGSYDHGTYSYANAAYVVVPLSNTYATTLGNLVSTSPLMSTINCVKAGGGTAYADALDAAYQELVKDGRTGTQKVIVFLSDGAANDGPGSYASTSPYVVSPCGQGVTSAGVAKANKVLVYSIAYTGNGDACNISVGAKNPATGKIVTASQYDSIAEPDGLTASGALQQIASPNTANNTYFYNLPTAQSLTGIFTSIAGDILQGHSRING